MKSASRFLLLATLLFCSIKLLAQEKVNKGDMIIHITISGSGSLGNDFIDIHKRDAKAEIIYKKFNRVNFDDLRIDTAYTNMDRKAKDTNPKKLGQIIDRHRIYDTTKVSIDLKTDTVYYKTLQLLTQASKQELETSKIGERTYLDGFVFLCEIITDTGSKNININNPAADTHPIVSSLLEESFTRLFKKPLTK